MAVQAQLYNTGNKRFPPFQYEGFSGHNGGLDQVCINLQQNQQIIHQETIQPPLMEYSQSMDTHMEKQRLELDQYITLHNERLRLILQEQRKQEITMLLERLEPKASVLFRQKDKEISKASKRATELEKLLTKLEMEKHTCQRLARENEAMVVSLSSALEQMRERAATTSGRPDDDEEGAEDAASFCGGENRATLGGCRKCGCSDSCVVFLPCRHLCSCKDCVAFLDYCPICRTPKKGSIEALI